MDYLDAMIEAYFNEMGLWKIGLFADNAYEISRGSLLVERGSADTGGPHFKYEKFNTRKRCALG